MNKIYTLYDNKEKKIMQKFTNKDSEFGEKLNKIVSIMKNYKLKMKSFCDDYNQAVKSMRKLESNSKSDKYSKKLKKFNLNDLIGNISSINEKHSYLKNKSQNINKTFIHIMNQHSKEFNKKMIGSRVLEEMNDSVITKDCDSFYGVSMQLYNEDSLLGDVNGLLENNFINEDMLNIYR